MVTTVHVQNRNECVSPVSNFKQFMEEFKSSLCFMFDLLNHWMFGLSLSKTNWPWPLWIWEHMQVSLRLCMNVFISCNSTNDRKKKTLKANFEPLSKFSVTYLKYSHAYLCVTSFLHPHYHISLVKHPMELNGKTGTCSQSFQDAPICL